MKSTLLLGYGNPYRQDDGVALHVLIQLAEIYGHVMEGNPIDSFFPKGENPDLLFNLQIMPEMAKIIGDYNRICFIDAHAGPSAEKIRNVSVTPCYQPSTLTHHMTPSSLLSLSTTINGFSPEAILVSIQGYKFGFSQVLSAETAQLVPKAVIDIQAWVKGLSH